MRVGKLEVAVAVGAAACLLGAGSSALAASTPHGGKVRVFVTNTSQTRGKILLTGAIGDYGTTVSQDADGKVDPNGDFEKVALKHGGFIVDATALDRKVNRAKPTLNPANCSFSLTASGPTTLKDGTGAYAGIGGTVVITLTYAGIVPKTAQGCELSNNAPTYGGYQAISGVGTVSFK